MNEDIETEINNHIATINRDQEVHCESLRTDVYDTISDRWPFEQVIEEQEALQIVETVYELVEFRNDAYHSKLVALGLSKAQQFHLKGSQSAFAAYRDLEETFCTEDEDLKNCIHSGVTERATGTGMVLSVPVIPPSRKPMLHAEFVRRYGA